jgi:hypothetical protein
LIAVTIARQRFSGNQPSGHRLRILAGDQAIGIGVTGAQGLKGSLCQDLMRRPGGMLVVITLCSAPDNGSTSFPGNMVSRWLP